MAGILKSNLQLGDSSTPTDNFVLSVPDTPDGTVALKRGNAGATTQDIITVDVDGKVNFPQGIGTGLPETGVTAFNTRTGAVTLTSGDVTTALGFTPTSGSDYVTKDNPGIGMFVTAWAGGVHSGIVGTFYLFSPEVSAFVPIYTGGSWKIQQLLGGVVGGWYYPCILQRVA